MEDEIKRVEILQEDATNRIKWREGLRAVAIRVRYIRPTSLARKNQSKNGW